MPVPQAKDTGAKYKEHVVSTGPYMFDDQRAGQELHAGAQRPNWDPATDPNRKALPDSIEVKLNVNADDIDNQLLAGDLDVDVAGTGVQPATQAGSLDDPKLKANADNRAVARLWFTSINADVAPFDNIDCRKAVEYAADHDGYQRAYGGASPVATSPPACCRR